MSRRKNRGLIKESEVSKLMKLSGLKNLTESFIAEQFEDKEENMDDMDMDVDLPEEEPAMEVGTAEFEGTPEDVEQLVSALADVLAAHTGVDIEVDGEDMGDEDLDVDLEDEEGDEEPLELDDKDDELEGEEEELALERIQRGREAAPGRRGLGESISIGDVLNRPAVKKDGDKEKEEPRKSRKPRRKPPKPPSAGLAGKVGKVREGEMEEEYMMEGEEEEGEKPEDKFELPLKMKGEPGKKKKRREPRKPRKPSAGLAGKIREGELEEASCSDPNEYKMMEESVQNEIAKKVVAMLLEKLANKE